MSKQTDKIWRTVVFSGAMLAAPLVTADTVKAQLPPTQLAKPKPPPPTPRELAQRDYDDANKRMSEALEAFVGAIDLAERDAAKKKVIAAKADRAAAEKKLAGYPAPGAPVYADPAAVKKIEKQISDLDTRISLALETAVTAIDEPDRKMATAKVISLRKERADATAKLVAEKAKPLKRPRQPDADRPVGRGFILS